MHLLVADNWNWVMDWEDLMPIHTMASLLDKLFFPKWLQVLTVWLNHSPDYEQVSKWYSGWKSMFSDSLLQQPVIKGNKVIVLNILVISLPHNGTFVGSLKSACLIKISTYSIYCRTLPQGSGPYEQSCFKPWPVSASTYS